MGDKLFVSRSSPRVRHAITLVVVLASLCSGRPALAFCRSMTCELGDADTCPRDANSCVTEGVPLHWGSSCLTYAVQKDGSPKEGLSAEQTRALIDEAFGLWANAACPGGGAPSFEAQFQGFVSCAQKEAVCDRPNVNIVMFHDADWPHAVSAIAVTTPSAGISTGLIVDADLEINSQDYALSPSPTMGELALLPVLAHELGHFLGLAHSEVPGALMNPGYSTIPMGADLLTPDDTAAICAVYPPGPALACAAPGPPAYDTCQVDPSAPPECHLGSISQDARGCGCRLGTQRGSHGGAGLALALLLMGRVRRRVKAGQRQR